MTGVTVKVGVAGVTLVTPLSSITYTEEQARALRDGLNEVLPERIEDLLHDPRIKDLHVLQAARVILGDRWQDTENLSAAIDHIERQEPRRCALCRCDATEAKHGIAVCAYHYQNGEDDPPCPTCECEPPERAPGRRVRWVSDEWVNGRNATLATDERRVSASVVTRTYTVEGYVLDRHHLPELRHTERFPSYGEAIGVGEDWTHRAEWPGHTEQPDVYDAPAEVVDDDEDTDDYPVAAGDRVRDPQDGRWRTVTHVDHAEGTVYMADGGCMSADECGDIRLPSEDLD